MWQHTPLSGLGIYDLLRKAFCQSLDKTKKISPDYFLLTRKGGRCEDCQGRGLHSISLDYLGNSYTSCETCDGTSYNKEARDIRSKGFSFNEILELSIRQFEIYY